MTYAEGTSSAKGSYTLTIEQCIRRWLDTGFREHRSQSFTDLETFRASIKKIHIAKIGDLTVGEMCARAAIPESQAMLMHGLIKYVKPSTCLEFGTNLGISAAYQGLALRENGLGRLYTMDINAEAAKVARKCFDILGLDNIEIVLGNFDLILPELLERIGLINFVYLDGNHNKEPTLRYVDLLYPCLSDQSLIVFDDIRWSKGMTEAWDIIMRDTRFDMVADLGRFGIGAVDRRSTRQRIVFGSQSISAAPA